MTSVSTDPDQNNYEAVVREMIAKEDQRTNERMLWLAQFNGLLFAALGLAWEKPGARFLTTVFSFLGLAASSLNALALIWASLAQKRLVLWWQSRRPTPYAGPGVIGGMPAVAAINERMRSFYFTPWILLAIAFAAGWLAILVYRLTH